MFSFQCLVFSVLRWSPGQLTDQRSGISAHSAQAQCTVHTVMHWTVHSAQCTCVHSAHSAALHRGLRPLPIKLRAGRQPTLHSSRPYAVTEWKLPATREEQRQKLFISRHLFWASHLRDTSTFLTAFGAAIEMGSLAITSRGEEDGKLTVIILDNLWFFCDLTESLSIQVNSEHLLIHHFENFTLFLCIK